MIEDKSFEKIYCDNDYKITLIYNEQDYEEVILTIENTDTNDSIIFSPRITMYMIDMLLHCIKYFSSKGNSDKCRWSCNCGGLHDINIESIDDKLIITTMYEDDDSYSIDVNGDIDYECNYHEYYGTIITCTTQQLCAYFKEMIKVIKFRDKIKQTKNNYISDCYIKVF